jgi:hypothetical protein
MDGKKFRNGTNSIVVACSKVVNAHLSKNITKPMTFSPLNFAQISPVRVGRCAIYYGCSVVPQYSFVD